MLHGYSQNSATFRQKLRRLDERLHATFPNTELIWPEGPIRLDPTDVPGYDFACNYERYAVEGPELRAWFDLRNVQDLPRGLWQSLDMLAEVLRRDGTFDGVIAFSQGTVLAALLASLLQGKPRQDAYRRAQQKSANAAVMPYPEAFLKVRHPPFKFGILYAGRVGSGTYSDWLYADPPIVTPFCHFVGQWDPMVDHEERDAVLAKLSADHGSRTIFHGGGHFVPVDDASIEHVIGFIAERGSLMGTSGCGCLAPMKDGVDKSRAVKSDKSYTTRKGMTVVSRGTK